jgi:hypothetical protein
MAARENDGREWKMHELVFKVAPKWPTCKQERERLRKGVRRVLDCLIEAKAVEYKPARRGGTRLYRWKAGHEVLAKRD